MVLFLYRYIIYVWLSIMKGLVLLEYLTTSEVVEVWNITRRRVSVLCKEGRMDGAVLKGKTWLIPADTVKPEDG